MISKSLIKLIDEAIVPAVLLILVKGIGLFATVVFFNLPFTLEYRSIFGLLPSFRFATLQGYITAENYSNLAMFAAVTAGAIIVILKAHFLHESHIHPKLHARLIALNLERLVQSSYHLYHQAAIWLIFLWLTFGFLTLSSVAKITYPQITIAAFLVVANLSWIFALDLEKEIEISKGKI
ncbi:MAG: hypothetical protein UU34_C0023G0009 [Candidatus Curtissbacteria bacterium GW2011_GWA1_41_11]|uniref:Uncharacterized protein n=1 Tax=Candidatus Curtissbacteria bacterium GW2011_GWA1_41_11 TaxID=1618409 RepID=A0A0G0UAK5_9BACT|nr:MAG: hypothetical protein UU34_C0023G0009 [Candidatus Curtissbacteria bacterium GW2011_GWA1_41_11]